MPVRRAEDKRFETVLHFTGTGHMTSPVPNNAVCCILWALGAISIEQDILEHWMTLTVRI